jgi:hypothetical protein
MFKINFSLAKMSFGKERKRNYHKLHNWESHFEVKTFSDIHLINTLSWRELLITSIQEKKEVKKEESTLENNFCKNKLSFFCCAATAIQEGKSE